MRTCKVTGRPLPANLYNDNRGRENVYRYRAPSGNFTKIEKPYDQAVALAEKANETRDSIPANRYSLPYWVGEYIEFAETQNPALLDKTGWIQSRRNYLYRFSEEFGSYRTDRLDIGALSKWWNGLTFDQQHNRRPDLSRLFVFMMGNGAARSNPFNTRDDQAHLMKRAKPKKQRLPIHEPEFWKVYEHASQHVRDAMVISLVTTLRRGDVVKLQFEHVVDNALRVTIGKSVGQRGYSRAAHLAWSLEDHSVLRDTINQARERSLSLLRCPYIVAAKSRAEPARGKKHRYQVSAEAISRGFKKAVDASGIWADIPATRTPPSFHEIRGLAIERMLSAGHELRDVQKVAAHTDGSITSGYAANHDPDYQAVNLVSPIKIPV